MVDKATLMQTSALLALAQSGTQADCRRCAALACPGWESVPSTFDISVLTQVGTLVNPRIEDPTLDEYHPKGTHGWSADAPIAPAYFPYNRCTVWTCTGCSKVFLRYTEYGGYYIDERIRAVDPALVAEAAPNIAL